jgi:hypothetical protein
MRGWHALAICTLGAHGGVCPHSYHLGAVQIDASEVFTFRVVIAIMVRLVRVEDYPR